MESVCWSLVRYLPPQNAEKKRFNHGKWRCCYRAIFQEGKKKSELHLNQMNLCTDLPMINYFCIFFWTKIIIEMAHLRLKQSLRVFGRKKILAMRHRRTKWSDKRKDMYFRNYVKSSQSSGYLVRHTRPTAIGCARGCNVMLLWVDTNILCPRTGKLSEMHFQSFGSTLRIAPCSNQWMNR